MRKIIAGMFITLDGVYLGPEGDGHPVALADITQCDNSSITSISDRRIFAVDVRSATARHL